MSGDHAKKEMVTGEKPATSHGKAPSGESYNKGKEKESPSHKSRRSDEVAQIQHFNSQASTILLASLSREMYNKVQGLKGAKEIWDTLKTAYEGDEVTKITKRETIEGELGRFRLRQGEEPQDMYNRLKTLVNQVRNLGSKKWDDHEMVKVILRSLVFFSTLRKFN
jgi:hypothetical protein